jgi:two-component system response regulator DevR
MIRVVICDDHEMVREALSAVLNLEDDISVVGMSDSLVTTRSAIDAAVPDVLVVDVRLQGESGLDIARMVRSDYANVKIIVLTSFKSDEALVEASEIGASAFLIKTGSADELIRVIRDIAGGKKLIDAAEVQAAIDSLEKKGLSIVRGLDSNDRQIARLISLGYSDKQIAETVFLGLQTVRNRVSRLLTRFEKENRTQLALFFAEYHNDITDKSEIAGTSKGLTEKQSPL